MIDTSTRLPARTALALVVLASCALGGPGAQGAPARVAAPADWLAVRHPGDRGMAGDPAVVWYEDFSEGSVGAVLARYDAHQHRAGMALVADAPPGSPSRYALRLRSGGAHPATYLYKSFGHGYLSLFVRYYIRYIDHGPWHHSGVWIGGYNPPLLYPYPRAGLRPSGAHWFSVALEPIPALPHTPMDLYIYWRGMHSWKADPTGRRYDYFGNTVLQDPHARLRSNTWMCYEIHLKLNPNPASGAGAVLEVWQNNRRIRRFDDHGPVGYWIRDKFCPLHGSGPQCTRYRPAHPHLTVLDQRWRTSRALTLNYFWPQNYNTAKRDSSLLLADIIVARRRIGCMTPATAASRP